MGWAGIRGHAVSHTARRWLIAYCALGVIEFGALAIVRDGPAVTRTDPGPYRGTPTELVAAGQELGIPRSSIDRLQVRWGLPVGLHEPRPDYTTAAYFGGHIYLAPGTNPVDALAYEYLHDVWAHLTPLQRVRVTALLDQFYADRRAELEPGLGELVRADGSNGATSTAARPDELHSIACSRTRDQHLRPALLAYCNVVLTGRRSTTKVY